jgi:AcrR family transcriptional regulator
MADRPLRADARRNREKVLLAARAAFAESGYDVPLDEIAARAGVGPGTVYRHFPTKEALFEAVAVARVEDLIADARSRADAADPGEAFFGFLGRVGDEAVSKRDMPAVIEVRGELRQELYGALGTLLRRAQRSGAVRGDIGVPELIVLLKSLLTGIQEAPALKDTVQAVITDGLRARSLPAQRWPTGGATALSMSHRWGHYMGSGWASEAGVPPRTRRLTSVRRWTNSRSSLVAIWSRGLGRLTGISARTRPGPADSTITRSPV